MLQNNIFAAVILVGFGATAAYSSELCVRVNDELGRPLPGGWIHVAELTTAEDYTNAVDKAGRACFKLPEGVYSIEAGHVGFLNVRYYPIRIVAGRERPDTVMSLPLGDVLEGEIAKDSVLSGSVFLDGKPVQSDQVCLLKKRTREIVSCALTNEFGEYAVTVSPGIYDLEVRTWKKMLFSSTEDLSSPGSHRKRIVIPTN